MSLDFSNLMASCQKLLKDFNDSAITDGLITAGTSQLINFDEFANLTDLPADKHLIGIRDFSYELNEGTALVEVLLGVLTVNDANLLIMNALLNKLMKLVKPGCRVDYVDGSTGSKLGTMTVANGTAVLPIDRTRTRPARFIGVRLAVGFDSAP